MRLVVLMQFVFMKEIVLKNILKSTPVKANLFKISF